jgi:DNA-binding Xre family transcriptional regulator
MENDEIEVTIKLKSRTFNEMLKLIRYQNLRNEYRKRDKPTDLDIVDFVTGCVNLYIEQVETPERLSGLNDLGRPFRLKNRFEEIMKRKNLKQIQLAKMTGIDPGNISPILKNKNQPSLDYFLRIWVALDCPSLDTVLYREE